MSQYVPPEVDAFLPPWGKRFFDAGYVGEQEALRNKAKVNLSMVRNRDLELRSLTQEVADLIFQSLLQSAPIKTHTVSTLSGENPSSLPTATAPTATAPTATAPTHNADGTVRTIVRTPSLSHSLTYGIYFQEIAPKLGLLERLAVELKLAGLLPMSGAGVGGVGVGGVGGGVFEPTEGESGV
eukprot:CAMPEP_0173318318 /NCGR_PEP_ID=MMETSP1143-20121109/27591_1 /TAXON_ID=483371 /ORGANISM="non described non described, Strain CCMP2298" /LENGTH=182 /DNA_ID=CAMNT_0014261551 /DNA_START=270 /DNA_END=818 /DNA_ORIENTATION=+